MKPNELLDAVSGLARLYEKLSPADMDRFNVFTILRKPNEEVMLHSRFIYELLNPKGSQKTRFTPGINPDSLKDILQLSLQNTSGILKK